MLVIPTRANLLVLTGTNYASLFGVRRAANHMLECSGDLPAEVCEFDDIPAEFTSIGAWPKKTGLKCWNCARVPTDFPRFIAKNVTHDGETATFTVLGNFDSWSCASRYIDANFTGDTRWNYHSLLCIVESMFTGGPRKDHIPPALPMTVMQEFQGRRGMTPQQFRDRVNELYHDG